MLIIERYILFLNFPKLFGAAPANFADPVRGIGDFAEGRIGWMTRNCDPAAIGC
jgi:hypothetical protein